MPDGPARLSPKQARSIREATARVNIWHGSVRSGKTQASIIAFLHFLMTDCPREGRPVIIGASLDTVYRNVISQMVEFFEGTGEDPVLYTRNTTKAKIFGREVDIIGAPNIKAESRIRGMTIPAAYVDEGSLLPDLGFWQQLLNRQVTIPGARTYLTTNPDNPLHWLKADVIDRAEALGYRVWHFVPDDNPVLDDAAKATLAAQNTGVWFKRNVEGRWVIADGLIYDGFRMDDSDTGPSHVADTLPTILEWVVAIDPGVSSTSSALLIGLGDDERIYVAREWRWVAKDRQRSLAPVELAQHLAAWLDACEVDLGERINVWRTVIDSEDPGMQRQLWLDGGERGRFHGRFGSVRGAVKGPGSVASGIQKVASLLALDRMRVHFSCEGLLAEKQTYSWDPKASEVGEDKPIKSNDHSCDAERYGIEATYEWWRYWVVDET